MYKNYLFDVDGTLLPMDIEKFSDLYFKSLGKKASPVIGVAPDVLVKGVLCGLKAMSENDGSQKNYDAFWSAASQVCKKNLLEYSQVFEDYYNNEFEITQGGTWITPYAKKSVDYIKQHGGRLIAATNPIFPFIATKRRLEWAGVSPDDFEYITVYENSGFCKPNLKYFENICNECNILPDESIMIGNDVDEDMCAAELGFDTYLVTDCVINRKNRDVSRFKHGSFEDFYGFLTE